MALRASLGFVREGGGADRSGAPGGDPGPIPPGRRTGLDPRAAQVARTSAARSIQRDDGDIVTVYQWNDAGETGAFYGGRRYLAAAVWRP